VSYELRRDASPWGRVYNNPIAQPLYANTRQVQLIIWDCTPPNVLLERGVNAFARLLIPGATLKFLPPEFMNPQRFRCYSLAFWVDVLEPCSSQLLWMDSSESIVYVGRGLFTGLTPCYPVW